MEHTKTPWVLYSGKLVPEYPNRVVQVNDGNGKAVCHWTGFDAANQSRAAREANAEFIVRAVNCHDELMEACKLLIDFFPSGWAVPLGWGQAITQVQEAIKKAGEK